MALTHAERGTGLGDIREVRRLDGYLGKEQGEVAEKAGSCFLRLDALY